MWKSIVLCISLFGGAAMGLALGARFVEASALPAAAAIGLCVIGVVLILAAPSNEVSLESDTALTLTGATQPVAHDGHVRGHADADAGARLEPHADDAVSYLEYLTNLREWNCRSDRASQE